MSYSILVNGEPKGMIKPSRGLRQGDPLSPYLFLFCAEGLNALPRQAAADLSWRNVPRSKSYLLCMKLFLGQMINKEKTSLFFSKNTGEQAQKAIKVVLNVLAIQHYEKYLKLPSFVGRNKRAYFMQIKERIWARMQGWKEKLLSQAGKEVIIKAVVQSIHAYSMGVFKLPIGLCKDIEAMISELVRQIQVCVGGEEDVLIWPLTTDGGYSVQSAYHMLVAAEDCLIPSSSSLAHAHAVWKEIWKMKVPNKIRHFIWRAVKDSLPTKVNLKAQHLPVDDVCEGHGDHAESTLHSLCLCDQA
ncbi:uncharacterized protein LOC142644259 [Castanea sativa]|uniref:uncharacterized protein LOC142644259 n=1 Tax=Castanea sativa TaxID=21020 RepID=UPI003F64E0F3